jgi:hypothetical protein
MAPFWSGVAIGLAVGAVIFLACLIFAVVILAMYAISAVAYGFVVGWRTAPSFAEAWQRGCETAAPIEAQSRRIKAWGQARRQKDLAWMERHWATRWCARLNRRLLG